MYAVLLEFFLRAATLNFCFIFYRTAKPKGKKTIVLAKAKKLSQVTTLQNSSENKEDYGFEIDGEEDVKDVKPKVEEMELKPDLEKLKAKTRVHHYFFSC